MAEYPSEYVVYEHDTRPPQTRKFVGLLVVYVALFALADFLFASSAFWVTNVFFLGLLMFAQQPIVDKSIRSIGAVFTVPFEVMHRWKPKNRVVAFLWRYKFATLMSCFILICVVAGIAAEWIAPYDYRAQDLRHTLESPSAEHWLGTDRLGRDLFTHVLYSYRTLVGVSAATLMGGSLVLSTALGLLAGYKLGAFDRRVNRTGMFFALMPGLLLMIILSITLRPPYEDWMREMLSSNIALWAIGSALLFLAAFAIGTIGALIARTKWVRITMLSIAVVALATIVFTWLLQVDGFSDFLLISIVFLPFSWFGGMRMIRSEALSLREREFVLASQALGGSTWWITTRHLLPNVLGYVMLGLAGMLGYLVGAEISLTYLGFGVQSPTPSFGSLIFDGANIRVLQETPHLFWVPTIAVVSYILAWVLLGTQLTKIVSRTRE